MAELAQGLQSLRALAGLSLSALARAGLAKSTVSKLCTTGRSDPETLRALVTACAVPNDQVELWVRARARAYGLSGGQPAGSVRVSTAHPLLLGVHRAIQISGEPVGRLPSYVPRDIDSALDGVSAALAAAAETSGFVVLVGGSSVGKTRCLFEMLTKLLSDWWLLHPGHVQEIEDLAEAGFTGRVVVWLDELQRYLDGTHGRLTVGTVRTLLQGSGRVVLAGTIWPEHHARLYRPAAGDPDSHTYAREVLKLAHLIQVPQLFSPAERGRAQRLAGSDQQIAAALRSRDGGFTQAMAAAPDLVRWWQTTTPYARALTAAAFHAFRLGARSPLSARFLEQAAPGYCDEQDRLDGACQTR